MSTRLAARLALLAAVGTAALCGAAPALAVLSSDGGSGGLTPLAPADAETLVTSGEAGGGTTAVIVDGSTVLAAAALPGANTAVETGLTPEQAVGLEPAPSEDAFGVQLPKGCWANAVWHRWGTWPYQQKVTDTTYWCAVLGSHITLRTSTTTASGTLCSPSLPAAQLIAGGVGKGFTYFTMRASAVFSCATVIPWITIHESRHEDIRRDDVGATTVVRTG